MQWFNLIEDEKVKKIYSKYTIEDFWNWWSDKEEKYMEVRIQDWKLVKETGTKFNIPYSTSGVYVNNSKQVKAVIGYVRNKATVWFGINPRKKNKNLKGWNSFGSAEKGGSGEINVEEIKFLFIDIDRLSKSGVAGKQDLEHCDILANCILEKLDTENWAKDYIKICSGHGVQLLIKLDVGIVMPDVEFEQIKIKKEQGEELIYKPILNSEFLKIKNIIGLGIGKDILTYTKKIIKEKELLVEVDKTCFRIAQVGALHCTKNFKYDTFRWRGIVDLKNQKNDGFADYILSREIDEKTFKERSMFVPQKVQTKDKININKFFEHPLIKFTLENNFEYGEINNKLWFQVKCLIRDSEIDINGSNFLSYKRQFEAKVKGKLSSNLPDKRFSFNKDVINDFCFNQLIPPIYKVYEKRNKHNNFLKQDIDINICELYTDKFSLPDETTLKEDMQLCKDKLKFNEHNANLELIGRFLNTLISKYNKETIDYLCKYWLYKFLEYS